tara:strand:- start:1113 stop:1409 length:297 start_codon:yes stop_codon:yes gene_type:complete
MEKLNSTQRSFLRSKAHHLEPVVIIGKSGITDGTIETINKVIEKRELIKVKFREYKSEKKSLSNQISKLTDSHIIGIVGHTLILFRRNRDIEKQNYKL